MAISRGAGTEIIRSAWFEDIDDTSTILIYGVQHHIYTVLSVIIKCNSLQAVTDKMHLVMTGYDAKAGTTGQDHYLMGRVIPADETFVWNDKFSFNGHEPTDFSGPMDDATKQDAIADQASGVAQTLRAFSSDASDDFEIGITYIDQNNA